MRRDFRLASVPFSALDRELFKSDGKYRSYVNPITWKMNTRERAELHADVNDDVLSLDEDDKDMVFLAEYVGEEFSEIWRQASEINSSYLFIHQHVGSFLRMEKALERAENNRTRRKMKVFLRGVEEALEIYGRHAILIGS